MRGLDLDLRKQHGISGILRLYRLLEYQFLQNFCVLFSSVGRSLTIPNCVRKEDFDKIENKS